MVKQQLTYSNLGGWLIYRILLRTVALIFLVSFFGATVVAKAA
jgi:hypothetical protein